jgi:putative beta-lysine N-acetyltransferase
MDKIETFGKSKLSHGPDSNRVYLMNLHHNDFPEIIEHIAHLANKKGYTKQFIKIPAKFTPAFISSGFVLEAIVPKLYRGVEDAHFLGCYNDIKRSTPEQEALNAFQKILLQPSIRPSINLDKSYTICSLQEDEAKAMTEVFKKVFESYPFPIFDEEFIKSSMRDDGTRYFGVWHNNQLVAISSAECDDENQYAEMTDFAVLPAHQGKRLAIHLLTFMEDQLVQLNFKTFFTIARLHSLSMNKTFYNMNYKYAGTLHNNTQISGKIESMNVWYKNVTP